MTLATGDRIRVTSEELQGWDAPLLGREGTVTELGDDGVYVSFKLDNDPEGYGYTAPIECVELVDA